MRQDWLPPFSCREKTLKISRGAQEDMFMKKPAAFSRREHVRRMASSCEKTAAISHWPKVDDFVIADASSSLYAVGGPYSKTWVIVPLPYNL